MPLRKVATNMPLPDATPRSLEALVVDDDPEIRDLLVEHLRTRGFRVAAAGDGRAAIAAIERTRGQFGLILADLHLPGADGLAVLEAARAVNPSSCVVIITGYASLDSAIQAVRLGAYDYLTKPFSLGQIDVLLGRVEDRCALESENRQLLHRISARSADTAQTAHDRLAAIEHRLVAIERALLDLTTELSRRR